MNRITQEQVSIMYPIITQGKAYSVLCTMEKYNELFSESSKLEEDIELEYLDELRRFVNENYEKALNKIYNKLDSIHKTRTFDIEKIKLLPDDMIYEIKSYLEPELKYTRRFTLLRSMDERFDGNLRYVESYLFKVPKKLIIDMIKGCNITHYENPLTTNASKENWCRMIGAEVRKHFSISGDLIRMDKNLDRQNREYSTPKILDKWFKFFLYINTYQKYRDLLESKLKKTDAKLTVLKNKKIVVK